MKTTISSIAIILIICSTCLAQTQVVIDDPALNAYAADRSNLSDLSQEQQAMLDHCMPNPAGFACTVQYYVPQDAMLAQIFLQNEHGHIVYTSEPLAKGKGTFQVPVESLNNGTYYYTLVVDYAKIETRSMLIVR